MRFWVVACVVAGEAFTAGLSHAESPKAKSDVTTNVFSQRLDTDLSSNGYNPIVGRNHVLQFDAQKGRWGLKLDLQQAQSRDKSWNDVQASAYYRLTPSLRVGGGVGVEQDPDPLANRSGTSVLIAPRVRLETAFKF